MQSDAESGSYGQIEARKAVQHLPYACTTSHPCNTFCTHPPCCMLRTALLKHDAVVMPTQAGSASVLITCSPDASMAEKGNRDSCLQPKTAIAGCQAIIG